MQCIYFYILLCYIPVILGCHAAEDEDRRRKKRQATNQLTQEVDQTVFLRDFFVECLRSRAGDIWTWESVIDVTILDAQWYLNSADTSCNSGTNDDSSECWKSRLNQLLRLSSTLQGPSRECIDEYTLNVTGVLPNSRRKKRQADQPSSEECTDFYPNSPATRRFTRCNDRNVVLPPRRRDIDFPSVSQFVAEEVICSSELGDCSSNEEETLSSNDPSVPQWSYLFEAITRRDSPVRESVAFCNNQVFPLGSDNDQNCGPWQGWTACFCGRGGSRSRRRICQPGFTGNLRERERCTETNCRPSYSPLGIYFFQLFARLPPNFRVQYP